MEHKAKLMGPNENFVPKFLKDGGDVKVGGLRKVELESVNHEDMEGRKHVPDTNPKADEQSREVHGENPAEHWKLSGMEQPGMGNRSIEKEEKLNRPPRPFKYSREGHKMDGHSEY